MTGEERIVSWRVIIGFPKKVVTDLETEARPKFTVKQVYEEVEKYLEHKKKKENGNSTERES